MKLLFDKINRFVKFSALVLSLCFTVCTLSATAAPPVRIAVVPGGGSGIEQDIVDHIANELQNNPDIALSTTNPDWYVVCNIHERLDQVSGSIRYNGTVTVKTTDGHIISTVAVQKYNQDFSLSPGAPLNKYLVDSAAKEVISSISQRAIGPIQHAVQVEMETRERLVKAMALADDDKYEEAIALLSPISPETSHFKRVRELVDEFRMEEDTLEAMKNAQIKARQGRYSEAISMLKQVPKKSKRYKLAQEHTAIYRSRLGGSRPVKRVSRTDQSQR